MSEYVYEERMENKSRMMEWWWQKGRNMEGDKNKRDKKNRQIDRERAG